MSNPAHLLDCRPLRLRLGVCHNYGGKNRANRIYARGGRHEEVIHQRTRRRAKSAADLTDAKGRGLVEALRELTHPTVLSDRALRQPARIKAARRCARSDNARA